MVGSREERFLKIRMITASRIGLLALVELGMDDWLKLVLLLLIC